MNDEDGGLCMRCRKRFRWLGLVVIIISMLISISVSASAAPVTTEDQSVNLPEYQAPQLKENPSMFGLFVRLTVSLLLITGLAYALIKIIGRQWGYSSVGTWINILDQLALGQNKGIFITEIAGKVFVLGVTDHSINKLLEIDDKELVKLMKERLPREAQPQKIFGRWQGLIDLWRGIANSSRTGGTGRNFHHLIEQHLTRLRELSPDRRTSSSRGSSGGGKEGKNDDYHKE